MTPATLEAALPAATNTALTLVATTATEVYVGDEERSGSKTTVEAAWLRRGVVVTGQALGDVKSAWVYRLRVSKVGGTLAEIQTVAQEAFTAWHGQRLNVTGLDVIELRDPVVDLHPGELGVAAFEVTVLFHAREAQTG